MQHPKKARLSWILVLVVVLVLEAQCRSMVGCRSFGGHPHHPRLTESDLIDSSLEDEHEQKSPMQV
jgi:hypothetical protein